VSHHQLQGGRPSELKGQMLRFGPDVLQWKECSTMKEYLRRGLLSSSAYHIVTGAGLVLFSVIGKPSPIASVCVSFPLFPCIANCLAIQWRYLLFIVVLALELYLLLAPPSHPVEPSPFVDHIHENGTILGHLFPHRVVYQHVRLLHQVFLFVSVALSRVAPVLFPSLVHSNAAVDQQMVRVVADRLGMLAQSTERERAYAFAFHVF